MHESDSIHACAVLWSYFPALFQCPGYIFVSDSMTLQKLSPYFLMTQKRQKRQSRSCFCLWTCFVSGKTISSVSSFLITQPFTSHCAECGPHSLRLCCAVDQLVCYKCYFSSWVRPFWPFSVLLRWMCSIKDSH